MARRRVPRAMRRTSEDEKEYLQNAPDEHKIDSEFERPCISADEGNRKSSDDTSESESSDSPDHHPPWTEEDVIDLLRAMTDFAERKEMDPITNIKEFWRFMGMWMSFPVRKSQLLAKIRALRLDYILNLVKDNKLSQTPFESQVFRLSRMVWGEVDAEEGAGRNGTDQNEPKSESPQCPALLHELINLSKEPQLGSGFGKRYFRARIAKAKETKVNALEERWKKQKIEESSIRARQAALVHNTLKALMR